MFSIACPCFDLNRVKFRLGNVTEHSCKLSKVKDCLILH